jgi:hypothetical protein
MSDYISNRQQFKNYIAPVSDRQLGWLAYANNQPIDAMTTDAMRRGWLAANRNEAAALTSAVYGVEVAS